MLDIIHTHYTVYAVKVLQRLDRNVECLYSELFQLFLEQPAKTKWALDQR